MKRLKLEVLACHCLYSSEISGLVLPTHWICRMLHSFPLTTQLPHVSLVHMNYLISNDSISAYWTYFPLWFIMVPLVKDLFCALLTDETWSVLTKGYWPKGFLFLVPEPRIHIAFYCPCPTWKKKQKPAILYCMLNERCWQPMPCGEVGHSLMSCTMAFFTAACKFT